MCTYGYARVSSVDQNEDRQIIALSDCDAVFLDKQSGKDFDRPQYQAMLDVLRPGDTVRITSIDRLGRDYAEIQNQWRTLTRDGNVDIQVLDMPLLDTSRYKDLMGTFIADLVLQVLSFVAHTERENIRKRQAEGIAAAKARGVHCGRRAKPLPATFGEAVGLWQSGRLSMTKAAAYCGMPRTSFASRVRVS